MSAVIISGKELATEKRSYIKERVEQLISSKSVQPTLAVILVGDDPASHSYVKAKKESM